jgi:hypothetical protein
MRGAVVETADSTPGSKKLEDEFDPSKIEMRIE